MRSFSPTGTTPSTRPKIDTDHVVKRFSPSAPGLAVGIVVLMSLVAMLAGCATGPVGQSTRLNLDDFDAMTESQEGLILSFDHSMFIGVMTNVLFGVLAVHISSARTALANRVLLWGVNIGFVGFAVGLITTTQALKQTFTPIMGLALLYGIGVYLMELRSQPTTSM